jgi:hypothetical protein
MVEVIDNPAETSDIPDQGDGFPLHLAQNALVGKILEAKRTAELEAQKRELASQLAGTLRAVLAERMVSAPTEEFEAVVLPDKEQLKARRDGSNGNGSNGNGNGDGKGSERLTPDRVREAFSRLDGRSSTRTDR